MLHDHEKLDVYHLSLDFVVFANEVIEALPRGRSRLADQFTRASMSIVLNLAEGAGKHSKPDKRRFYVTARGSATESAALLDICLRLNLVSERHTRRVRTCSCGSSRCSSSWHRLARSEGSDAKPEQRAADGNHGGVVAQGLLVSCGKPTSLFEEVERALDFRTRLEELLVVRQLLRAAAIRWDYSCAVLFLKSASKIAGVIGLVRQQAPRQDPRDEFLGGLAVVTLTLSDLERERKSDGINDEVDLRRQTSA